MRNQKRVKIKHLSLELAKHPLIIKAFSDVRNQFTTEMVWAKTQRRNLGELYTQDEVVSLEDCYSDFADFTCCEILAPGLDLEELLDLAAKLWKTRTVPYPTNAEVTLYSVMEDIFMVGDRLSRLAEAIIPVLQERNCNEMTKIDQELGLQ